MSGVLPIPLVGLAGGALLEKVLRIRGANLQSFVDPGDIRSVASATAQTITDIAPLAAGDWWRGVDGGTSLDPDFNGTAGALQQENYQIATTNNEQLNAKALHPVYRDFHKTGSTSTLCFTVNFPSAFPSTFDLMFGTVPTILGDVGIYWEIISSDNKVHCIWSDGSTQDSVASSNTVSTGTWIFVGTSYNKPAGAAGSILNVNGTETTFNANTKNTTTSPSVLRWYTVATANYKIGPWAAWDTALTSAEMEQVRSLFATRY